MTSTARASRSRWPSQNAAHPVAAVLMASARAGVSATPRVCAAMTAVSVARRAPANDRMSGQRPSTAVAVANDPAKAIHTSGNAHRANDINRRHDRFASITAAARRITERRNASWAGSGSASGANSKTCPARVRTSASITSDLLLPMIAPRNRAECRAPTMCIVPPAFSTAIVSASQVIDVGSTTASMLS